MQHIKYAVSSEQMAKKALRIARLIDELSRAMTKSTPAAKDAYSAYLDFSDIDFRLKLIKFERALNIPYNNKD